ncbi:MAG: hypothetical protein LBK44_04045 [Spirochaetales bacterium]|nr:hypothetical protein [Spirochaetales bacterium]
MQILWAFRCNPGCMGEQKNCIRNFSTSPLRSGSSGPRPGNCRGAELPRPLTCIYAKSFLGPLAQKACYQKHACACVYLGMAIPQL